MVLISKSEPIEFGFRIKIACLFIACAFLGIFIRLWLLQVFYGKDYREMSTNNRTRAIRVIAPRGNIYDRNGQVLVQNRPSFNLTLMLEDVVDLNQTIGLISKLTNIEIEKLWGILNSEKKGKRHFEPKILIRDLTSEQLSKLKVNSYRLPGCIIEAVPTRRYVRGNMASQLLGYVREITKEQLAGDASKWYRPGDYLGQSGVEKSMEKLVRGKNGYVQVEVDSRGNRRRELGIIESVKGKDIYLTIDADLQAAAEDGLGEKSGAVVALDPRDGSVLVLASKPTFDPSIFSGRMDPIKWSEVAKDRKKPLNNRAISSRYPPGSTFKLVMAAAGLSSGKMSENEVINCPGYYRLKSRPYRCHKHSGHGAVVLRRAVAESCNVFFFTLGLNRLGIEGIHNYAKMFGLGMPTGVELSNEDAGTLPSDFWKRKLFGERWYPGDTLPVAIGQGYLTVTPIQMAQVMSVIGSSGKLYRPHLVSKIFDPQVGKMEDTTPELLSEVPIAPDIFAKVRALASGVVNDPGGTGKRAALNGINVGGKTGTAQVRALGRGKGEEFEDHAWFVSFAPVENPMIALAIIVEHGGHGGVAAAPISKSIMEIYFKKLGMLVEDTNVSDKNANQPESVSNVQED